MSVKGKVKKLNKKIENLQEELQTYQLSNSRLRNKNDRLKTELEEQKADKQYTEQLENILKFAITNHIGNLRGGMQIERYGIDKMQDLRLSIDYQPEFNSYIIRVSY
jgi:DNA repair exonuclease SbcCD ATPase subunit